MIRFDRVTFRYDSSANASPILGEVSFSLAPGALVGILGRNGAGKSTLCLLAAGLLLPGSGTVTVAGIDTRTRDPEIQRRVGILFQDPDHQIVGTTVEEDLAFGLENLGLPREQMIERVRWAASRFGLSDRLGDPVTDLSGGMRQKLALAGIMAMEPQVLILDEPSAQLDPWSRLELWETIAELRREHHLTVLVISQQGEDLDRLEEALVLAGGGVVFQGLASRLWDEGRSPSWGIPVPPGAALRRAGWSLETLPPGSWRGGGA